MSKLLSSVLLGFALVTPVVLHGQNHDRQDHQDQRYYDNSRKDYHQWNASEDREYHEYLKERHKKDHDWAKASKREQQAYWKWRHDHSDRH